MGKPVRLLTLVFAALLAAQGSAFAILSGPYLPLTLGNSWIYQLNGAGSQTTTAYASPSINGITVVRMGSSDGQDEYYSNDVNGIRLYRLDAPAQSIPCGFSSESDVYSPPLQFVPA